MERPSSHQSPARLPSGIPSRQGSGLSIWRQDSVCNNNVLTAADNPPPEPPAGPGGFLEQAFPAVVLPSGGWNLFGRPGDGDGARPRPPEQACLRPLWVPWVLPCPPPGARAGPSFSLQAPRREAWSPGASAGPFSAAPSRPRQDLGLLVPTCCTAFKQWYKFPRLCPAGPRFKVLGAGSFLPQNITNMCPQLLPTGAQQGHQPQY